MQLAELAALLDVELVEHDLPEAGKTRFDRRARHGVVAFQRLEVVPAQAAVRRQADHLQVLDELVQQQSVGRLLRGVALAPCPAVDVEPAQAAPVLGRNGPTCGVAAKLRRAELRFADFHLDRRQQFAGGVNDRVDATAARVGVSFERRECSARRDANQEAQWCVRCGSSRLQAVLKRLGNNLMLAGETNERHGEAVRGVLQDVRKRFGRVVLDLALLLLAGCRGAAVVEEDVR